MKNKKFFTLLFLELLVVLGIAAYFFIDSADIYKFIMGDTKFYEQSKQCDLHVKPCSITIPEYGEITLEISPKEIPLMQPLVFQIYTQGELANKTLDLNIYATNMNMGYQSLKMKKISDKVYEASVILPTCTVGGMIWRAEVVIGNVAGAFSFKTK
jgi:hypothetical protein